MGRHLCGGTILALFYALISFSCTTSSDSSGSGTVYVSHDDTLGYQIIRDGSPFFVKGASGSSHLELLKEYGGNTVRVYSPDSLGRILDEAQRLGLAVVADLPLPQYDRRYPGLSDPEEMERQLVGLRKIVKAHKDHPALLYWMLGNEVFQSGYDRKFVQGYNTLAAAIREMDPNHPVSTAAIRHQLAGMELSWQEVDVDFISLNIFGKLSSLDDTKFWLSAVWRGPYLFSEWSTNGPWESELTAWQVPIEATSRKKAEQLRERYAGFVEPIHDGRFLGSLAFYWGFKHEQTPTWFSLFSADGRTSEMAFTLQNLWNGTNVEYPGPGIEYLLLNGKGAKDEVMLPAGSEVTATATFPTPVPDTGELTYQWRVSPEDWLGEKAMPEDITALNQLMISSSIDSLHFRVPSLSGPYRVYLSVTDTAGYFATANIPFFVLSTGNAK